MVNRGTGLPTRFPSGVLVERYSTHERKPRADLRKNWYRIEFCFCEPMSWSVGAVWSILEKNLSTKAADQILNNRLVFKKPLINPQPTSAAVSRSMQGNRAKDSKPEVAL